MIDIARVNREDISEMDVERQKRDQQRDWNTGNDQAPPRCLYVRAQRGFHIQRPKKRQEQMNRVVDRLQRLVQSARIAKRRSVDQPAAGVDYKHKNRRIDQAIELPLQRRRTDHLLLCDQDDRQ